MGDLLYYTMKTVVYLLVDLNLSRKSFFAFGNIEAEYAVLELGGGRIEIEISVDGKLQHIGVRAFDLIEQVPSFRSVVLACGCYVELLLLGRDGDVFFDDAW